MRVTIPEPCSENWEQMSLSSDASRYCASCQKCVVDFSMMSDREIVQKLNASDDNVCGRFTSAQLDRVLIAQTYKPRNYWSAFFSMALTSVVGLSSAVQTKMGLKPKMEISHNENRVFSENKIESGGLDSVIIRGKVIDSESLKPISGAMVRLKDVSIHTYTQSNGNFEIKIHQRYLSKNSVLVVSHSNSTPTQILLTKDNLSKPIELKLKYVEDSYLMGKAAISPKKESKPTKLMNRVLPKNK